jgi:hypothetical protein
MSFNKEFLVKEEMNEEDPIGTPQIWMSSIMVVNKQERK